MENKIEGQQYFYVYTVRNPNEKLTVFTIIREFILDTGISGSTLRGAEAGGARSLSSVETLDKSDAEANYRSAGLTSTELLALEPTTAERLLGDVDNDAVENPDATEKANETSPEEAAETSPEKEAETPPEGAAKTPDEILNEYQVASDTTTQWQPKLGPFTFINVPVVDPVPMTETEADLLDDLGSQKGIAGLNKFREIRDDAFSEAERNFPTVDANGNPIAGGDDGHNDAFRHTLWNARMTKSFGEDFAAAFGTAHEGIPNNQADREAMDLYNNEVGRRIAVDNPEATDAELSELVAEAVNNGETVVIDGNNDLAYSDQVAVGSTGVADDPPAAGGKQVPAFDSGSW